MSSPLFRKEVIQNNRQRLLGDVLVLRPVSFWIFTFAVVFVVAGIVCMLSFGKFFRKEITTGYLVPDKGVVRIYAPFNGVINQKYIIDGQKVVKGQNLLEVTTERGTKDSLSIHQQLMYRLLEQKTSLDKRIVDESKVLDSESDRLSIILVNLNNEYHQIRQQIRSQQEQLQLIKKQRDTYQELRSKGLVSEDDLISKRNAYYTIKASLDASKRLQISKRTEITNTQNQIEQAPLHKNNRLQELQHQYTQLEERIIELENSHSYVIKAAVDGRITSSQVNIGQNVFSAKPILTIIPENTILYAELFLPSRAIGFVKKNQKVLMRYDAFPYQRYGLYEGKIIQIAEAVIHPNETTLPIVLTEPVYRVKVALDKQSIDAYGKQMQLQSGMLVTADIILEERSLGQWLLEPIYSLKGRL